MRYRTAVLGIGMLTMLWMVHAAYGQPSDLPVLTLQQAERTALENHPGIRAVSERVKVQEAVLARAKANFYPTVGIRGLYENDPATENVNRHKNLSASVGQVEWLVSDFGRRESRVRLEQDTLEARRFREKMTEEDIVLAVRRGFYNYLRARALVRVEEDTVKDRETLVRQAQGFFEVGTRPKIDVARAEASLFAAKTGLISAQNGVKIAWARLKSAMGVTNFPERPVASDVHVRPSPLSLDDAVKAAFESRAEIEEFRSQLKARQEAIDLAKLGRMPSLRFTGQYGWRWHNDQDIISSMLTLDIPVFNGFTLKPEIERAVRDHAVVKAQLQEQQQRIALEVEESLLNLLEAGERIKANDAQKKSAKENLDLANGRYQVGVGSIIEITEAQVINSRAQTDHIRSIYDHKFAEALLARSMGRGSEFSP